MPVTDLQRLLAALEGMAENVRFMRDLPGSDSIVIAPDVLRLMENSAKLLAEMSENVRAMAAKIAASGPRPRGRITLN